MTAVRFVLSTMNSSCAVKCAGAARTVGGLFGAADTVAGLPASPDRSYYGQNPARATPLPAIDARYLREFSVK